MADLLFDCYSGVSGDMIVGSLLDLGADANILTNAINSLNLTDFTIKISKINKKGTLATDFDVVLKENNFDHDMSYLYGNKKISTTKFEERNLQKIDEIIEKSLLTVNAKDIAKQIFEMVAKAEAKAHGVKIEDVVFHESGAMDSIIDIVSIAVCIDNLNIDNIFITNLRKGKGKIQTRVGLLPIPTPAVKNVLDMYDVKIATCDESVELITPTGIAAIAVLTKFKNIEKDRKYSILKTGYGAGKRDYNLPCTLKAMIIQ